MKITISFLLALGLAQASVIPQLRLAAFDGPQAYGYGILGAGGLVQGSSLISEQVIGLKALPVGLTSGVAVAQAPGLIASGLPLAPAPFLTLGAAPVVAQESTAPVETPAPEAPASDDSVAVEADLKEAPAEEPATEEAPAPAPAEEAAPAEAAPAEEAAPVEEAAPAAPEAPLPVPVDDTPEVAQARAAHLAAVEDAKLRNALAEKVYVAGPVAYPAPLAYSAPVAYPAVQYAAPTLVRTSAVVPAPVAVSAPVAVPAQVAVAAPVAGVVSSQYHSQDELGQYSYGYAGGPSAKDEIKTFDGVTRGGYSYVDANGVVQHTSYVADPVNGFRVASTNLPVGPAPTYLADTPEVAEAKANLLKLQAEHVAKL